MTNRSNVEPRLLLSIIAFILLISGASFQAQEEGWLYFAYIKTAADHLLSGGMFLSDFWYGPAGFDESSIRFEEWLAGSEPDENIWDVTAIARKL